MLLWFEVENFKSIRKLHLDFTPFMVLVGPNGAGKTNIVQALSLLLDIVSAGSTDPIGYYGEYEQLIRRRKQRAKTGIRLALRCELPGKTFPVPTKDNDARPLRLQLEILLRPLVDPAVPEIWRESVAIEQEGREAFRYTFSVNELEEFELGTIEVVKESLGHSFSDVRKTKLAARIAELDGSTLKLAQLFSFRLNKRLPGVTRLRLDSSSLRDDSIVGPRRLGKVLGQSGEGLPVAVERMRKSKSPQRETFDLILSRLRNVYPRIEDVSTIHFQPGRVALSFKEQKIDGQLGEANVSDGVMHALALLVALYRTSDSDVLIIEEPENALHPWALNRIITDVQEDVRRAEPLLFTTHSPILVNAVKQPESLFIVENHEEKGTLIFPALEKEAALKAILAESGQKLGDVWLDGTLGGVPGVEP
jgi:predicted ATPase